MSTQTVLVGSGTASRPPLHASFPGMVRGEFPKVARFFWLMLLILTIGFLLAFLLGAAPPNVKTDLQHTPLHYFYYTLESNLVIFRILSGILLLVLTSLSIGREYQYGTIRVLLARGAGRVQLLLAKLVMLGGVALLLLVAFTLLIALLACAQVVLLTGNLQALNALTPAFWANAGLDWLTVVINMVATILLTAAMNALGRSLTFGLSASLVWFPFDNISALLLNTLARVTQNDAWNTVSGYFLGPLLNRLPTTLLPVEARSGFESFGSGAFTPISIPHALWVIFAYALVCCVLALVPTWKRDVRE